MMQSICIALTLQTKQLSGQNLKIHRATLSKRRVLVFYFFMLVLWIFSMQVSDVFKILEVNNKLLVLAVFKIDYYLLLKWNNQQESIW